MPMTNAFRDFVASDVIGEAVTEFDNTNAYIGVGDSNTVFAATQTDLQAAVNKLRKGMEAGYPSRSANVIDFRALFGTADANWSWLEWAVFNASAAGVMMNRKVENLGTKTAAQSWQLTVQNTLNAA